MTVRDQFIEQHLNYVPSLIVSKIPTLHSWTQNAIRVIQLADR